MPFDDFELSVQSARPQELYTFENDENVWRYCSGGTDYVYQGQMFFAIDISRSNPTASQENTKGNINITVSRLTPIVLLYSRIAPPFPTSVIIQQLHLEDDEPVVVWNGTITSVDFQGKRAVIQCEPPERAFRKRGLWKQQTVECTHVLGDERCGVDLESYKIVTAVTDVQDGGLQLVSDDLAGEANGWWVNGKVRRLLDRDIRFIIAHSGSNITLLTPFDDLQDGELIQVYPGGDYSFGDGCCGPGKYNNRNRYGGKPFMPKVDGFKSLT